MHSYILIVAMILIYPSLPSKYDSSYVEQVLQTIIVSYSPLSHKVLDTTEQINTQLTENSW